MSKPYKGVGTLTHLVNESNATAQRLKESGEYFKNHTFQKRDDKKHDIDFKSTPDAESVNDKIVGDKVKNAVEPKDEKKYDVTTTYGLKDYLKDVKAKEPKSDKESVLKNIKMGPYSENWYRELKGYMKRV